ncbi:MAG: hypothetical protein OIF38_14375 [Cellvibrionaceae bacterium]|nr:hypothetical protein [Cellvibrionaceae bacterium]
MNPSKTTITSVGFFAALWFAIGLGLFLARFLPLGEALDKAFWAGLLIPIIWASTGIWLYSRERFWLHTKLVLGLGLALIGTTVAGIML